MIPASVCFWQAFYFSGESRFLFLHGLTVKLESAVEKGERVSHTQICILGPLLARAPPQLRADLPDGDTGTLAARRGHPSPPTQVSPGRRRRASDSRPTPSPNPEHTAHLHQTTGAWLRRCKMDTATTPSASRRLRLRTAQVAQPLGRALVSASRRPEEFCCCFWLLLLLFLAFFQEQQQKHTAQPFTPLCLLLRTQRAQRSLGRTPLTQLYVQKGTATANPLGGKNF